MKVPRVKGAVPRVKGAVPKQAKVGDRGYEVFTQENPRFASSQKKAVEVYNGCSGWLSLFMLCFVCF